MVEKGKDRLLTRAVRKDDCRYRTATVRERSMRMAFAQTLTCAVRKDDCRYRTATVRESF